MRKDNVGLLRDIIEELDGTVRTLTVDGVKRDVGFESFILGGSRLGFKLTSSDFKKDYYLEEGVWDIEDIFDNLGEDEECVKYFYKYCENILSDKEIFRESDL